jgi:hypothetical protein
MNVVMRDEPGYFKGRQHTLRRRPKKHPPL